MGYIVLPAQLRAIHELTQRLTALESIELLWLPGVIQATIWTDGIAAPQTYNIDEDGFYIGN